MKRYTVARYCWVTLSLAAFAITDAILGLFYFSKGRGYGVLLAWMIMATFCGGGAVFMFLRGHWIKPIEVKPFDETPEYIHYARGANYAIKQELVRKEKYVKRLEENQKAVVKWVWIGALCGTLGGVIFGLASIGVDLTDAKRFYQSFVGLVYPFLAIGTAMIISGIRMMFHGFMNSDSQMAFELSEKYTFDTYGIKIWREKQLIGVLSERLEKEKAEERKRKEEYLREEQERMANIQVVIPENIDLRG